MSGPHRCPNRAHQDALLAVEEGFHHHTRAQVILCVHRKDRPLPSIEEEDYQAQAEWEAEGEDPMIAYERFLEDRYAYDS